MAPGARREVLMAADCKRPDETAMAGILEQHPCDTEGTILRLAWLQGLSRREINALTWDQVDFGENLLLLPDRSVPMEPSAAECLRRRRAMHHTPAGRVIVSHRSGTPLTAETVSRLARAALDAGGQAVSLMDLRHDWLRRRIAEGGWVYAAEVSGLSVRSLRDRFGAGAAPREVSPTGEADTEYALWRIVQREGSSPAGLAIWMCWRLGLRPGEAASLMWAQVDFAGDRICLPDRALPMGTRLSRLLGEAKPRQGRGQAVFAQPETGAPMGLPRVSAAAGEALRRGGLGQMTLRRLYERTAAQQAEARLTAAAEARGSLTREDAMALLGISENTATARLKRLTDDGRLTRVGVRFYPAGAVVPPEAREQALTSYLRARGLVSRRGAAELLGVTPQQAGRMLRRLAEEGRLVPVGRRYALPPEET